MTNLLRGKARAARIALAATLTLTLAGVGGVPPQAGALDQGPGLRVEADQSVEQEYPPIPLSFPLPALPDHKLVTPDDCKKTPYCHVIPFEVVPQANLDESDEFFVTVELLWETEKIEDGPEVTVPGEEPEPLYSEMLVNDLDMYIWDDPTPAEELEPEELAASSDLPEAARMYRPTKGKYQIVVLNYLGPNTGYKLRATYKTEKIEAPFELLEPDFSAPAMTDNGSSLPELPEEPVQDDFEAAPGRPTPRTTAADMTEVAPPSSLGVSAPPAPSLPSLSPVTIEPDADFGDFADSAFDEELAAPPGFEDDEVLRQRQAAAVGPAKPASGLSLLFWLAFVPLLLLGGAGGMLWKRNSTSMRLR